MTQTLHWFHGADLPVQFCKVSLGGRWVEMNPDLLLLRLSCSTVGRALSPDGCGFPPSLLVSSIPLLPLDDVPMGNRL